MLAIYLAAAVASSISSDRARDTAIYYNAARTEYFAIKDGKSSFDAVVSGTPIGGGDAVGDYAFRCDTREYTCVRTNTLAIAAPRDRRLRDFALAGTAFELKSCYRHQGSACVAGLMEADCQEVVTSESCRLVEGGRERAKWPGPVTYYVYDADVGVTSVGFARAKAGNLEEMEKVGREFVLSGSAALLAK